VVYRARDKTLPRAESVKATFLFELRVGDRMIEPTPVFMRLWRRQKHSGRLHPVGEQQNQPFQLSVNPSLEGLLQRAEAVDAAEDEKYGKDQAGDELPADLARRESRLAKIRAAKPELEAEAKQKAMSVERSFTASSGPSPEVRER
jgi:hypothetical protein